jgi:hypothetical protein
MTDELQILLDKQSIYEALVRYCRGVDRCDPAIVRSAYHEDASEDHGYWRGRGHDFADVVTERLRETSSATTHAITNALIEVNGDHATCESQVLGTVLQRDSDPQRIDTVAARYVDEFARRDGEWKIAKRVCVVDWFKTETVQSEAPVPMDGFLRGDRYPSDPIYELLSLAR